MELTSFELVLVAKAVLNKAGVDRVTRSGEWRAAASVIVVRQLDPPRGHVGGVRRGSCLSDITTHLLLETSREIYSVQSNMLKGVLHGAIYVYLSFCESRLTFAGQGFLKHGLHVLKRFRGGGVTKSQQGTNNNSESRKDHDQVFERFVFLFLCFSKDS